MSHSSFFIWLQCGFVSVVLTPFMGSLPTSPRNTFPYPVLGNLVFFSVPILIRIAQLVLPRSKTVDTSPMTMGLASLPGPRRIANPVAVCI
jgi:hypothetical protein